MMAAPRVMVLKEHGTNCEVEVKFAFEKAGARADVVHMEDLIASPRLLGEYQVLVFPGGFSYGDDTGAGLAWANRMRNHLGGEIMEFATGDRLALGVCNGFQAMVALGLLPLLGGKMTPRVALSPNENARYTDRWVDLEFFGKSPWVAGLRGMSLPIAHGEGRFQASEADLAEVENGGLVAARYVRGQVCESQDLPANPNGAMNSIAGITDPSGRILGMMPHPERAVDPTQLPDWPLTREKLRRAGGDLPEEGPGLALFRNAVAYFK